MRLIAMTTYDDRIAAAELRGARRTATFGCLLGLVFIAICAALLHVPAQHHSRPASPSVQSAVDDFVGHHVAGLRVSCAANRCVAFKAGLVVTLDRSYSVRMAVA